MGLLNEMVTSAIGAEQDNPVFKPKSDAGYLVECERDRTLYILSAYSANGIRTLYLTEEAAKRVAAPH